MNITVITMGTVVPMHVQGRRQLDLFSGLCNTTLTCHDNVLLVGSVSGYVLLFLFSFLVIAYICVSSTVV